jgi:hypothetical protein
MDILERIVIIEKIKKIKREESFIDAFEKMSFYNLKINIFNELNKNKTFTERYRTIIVHKLNKCKNKIELRNLRTEINYKKVTEEFRKLYKND